MKKPIEIDYFESLKLFDSVIYGGTILSHSIRVKFVDVWYHHYLPEQIKSFYEYMVRTKDSSYLKGEYLEWFNLILSRYNPDNQYEVTLENGDEKQTVIAFKHDDKYKLSSIMNCKEKHIKSIKKL
jgi:hypothetical protein